MQVGIGIHYGSQGQHNDLESEGLQMQTYDAVRSSRIIELSSIKGAANSNIEAS